MFATGWALKRLYKFVLKRLLGRALKNELDLEQVRCRRLRVWCLAPVLARVALDVGVGLCGAARLCALAS